MSEYHQTIAHDAAALKLRERVARAFGRSAAHYDDHADLQRHAADHLLRLLPHGEWQRVLDLGCGTGYCTQLLRQRLPQAALPAVDLTEPMLAMTREKTAHRPDEGRARSNPVHLLCGNAAALPLQAGSLDLVVSSLMLQWCADPMAVFSELARVLRPGGVALVSTFGPDTLQELRDAWAAVDSAHHTNGFASEAVLHAAATTSGLDFTLQAATQIRHYDSLQQLAQELKGLGANVVSGPRAPTTASAFKAASAAFSRQRQTQGIPVRWQLFSLVLRKPDA